MIIRNAICRITLIYFFFLFFQLPVVDPFLEKVSLSDLGKFSVIDHLIYFHFLGLHCKL